MTTSSKLIHAGLGAAIHVLAYVGTAAALVAGYALGNLAHARAMAKARRSPTVEVVEPDEQPTVMLVVVRGDEPETAAEQRWSVN